MTLNEEIRYSVVVPFYNEESNVRPLYDKIVAVMESLEEPFEMIFVDDGSRDRTFCILNDIFCSDRRTIVVRLRRNFGQTAALKAGFDAAQGEVIILMDGDLQHDPAEIPNFIAKIAEGYDIVSGWRVHRLDATLTRRFPSRVANWLISKLSGLKLHDFGTTFKAYRKEILDDLHLYGELHRFIPALATWAGASIVEIPIKNISRQNGKSNYGLSRTFRVLMDMISVKFLLKYVTRPLHFFGLFGATATGVGSVIGVFLLFKKILFGTNILIQHGLLLFMAVLLILSGLQFLAIGLLGEIQSRTYFESQNKPIYIVRELKRWNKNSEVVLEALSPMVTERQRIAWSIAVHQD